MKRDIPWNLIRSYLKNEILEEDELIFQKWLSMPENRQLFEEIEKVQWEVAIASMTCEPDTMIQWNKLQKHIRRKKNTRYLWVLIYAAIFIGIVFGSFLFLKLDEKRKLTISMIEQVQEPDVKSKDIQLVLSAEESLMVKEDTSKIVYNKNGTISVNSRKLDIKDSVSTKEQSIDEIQFNQLIVPEGKRSTLTLSDGSEIWVNSGSRVVYPAAFEKDKREIYVDGEIYIDVVPDENCPFYVRTNKMNIKVLGTSFNVNAYEDGETQSVVLVSGKVNIEEKVNRKQVVLSPNEMYTYTHETSQVDTVDVMNYILWKDGVFQFDSESLVTILDCLSRYYGVEFIYDSNIAEVQCSGKLYLKDDLGTIMGKLSDIFSFHYEFGSDNHCKIKYKQ